MPVIPHPLSSSVASQSKIRHVIIIFQENRTPDNLFQGLPNADIASSGRNSLGQTVPLVSVDMTAGYDINHSHGAFLASYNGNQMNGFDKVGFYRPRGPCTTLTAYGYVPPTQVSEYFQLARQYTFADRMFQTNQGPSFPAHQYIISGTSTDSATSTLLAAENVRYHDNERNCNAPAASLVSMIDPSGSERISMRPCFEHPTLFDLLDAKGVSWRYYESWTGGLWSGPDAISHIRNGSDWSNVITPETTVLSDIAARQLRSVSWVIPSGPESDHARITDGSGPAWVAAIVNAVGNSPYWSNTAIFVTWDDWGGWYDHVAPPMYNSYELDSACHSLSCRHTQSRRTCRTPSTNSAASCIL